MKDKIFKYVLVVVGGLVLSFAVAGLASAAITLNSTSVTSDGALTVNGAAASALTVGAAAQTGTVNVGTSTAAMTLNLGTGNGLHTINMGTGTAANAITIGGASSPVTFGERIILSPTFTGSSSRQSVEADATFSDYTGSSYGAGVMGNAMGTINASSVSTIAGLIGKYNIATNATAYPSAGVVGEVGEDSANTADAAVLAVLGGDDATLTGGTAYGVRYLNSTSASKFAYGLDLFASAIGSYQAVSYGTADIRLQNGETISNATDGAITISGALTGSPSTLTTTTAGGGSNLKLQYKQGTNALTGDYEGLHIRTSTDVGSAANAVNGIQVKAVANDVASQLTVATLRGAYASIDSKDNLVTTARAFEASLDGLAGSTITEAVGIELMNNSSGTQTASYGLSINGGTPSGHKAYTADIRLQNGETIYNTTNGVISLGSNDLATGVSVTSAAAGSGATIASLSSGTDEKLLLNSKGRSEIRLNSRTDSTTTGDLIGVQIKPGQGASKTAGNVIGIEISPRLNSGVALAASGSIIGAHIDTYLKGTAVGTVNGDVRGLQVELVTDDAGTRTVDGYVAGIRIRSAFSATGITGNFVPLRIEKPEVQTNSQNYDAVLDLTGDLAGVWNDNPGTEASAGTADGYIKVIVNGAVRYIQLYSSAPVD